MIRNLIGITVVVATLLVAVAGAALADFGGPSKSAVMGYANPQGCEQLKSGLLVCGSPVGSPEPSTPTATPEVTAAVETPVDPVETPTTIPVDTLPSTGSGPNS